MTIGGSFETVDIALNFHQVNMPVVGSVHIVVLALLAAVVSGFHSHLGYSGRLQRHFRQRTCSMLGSRYPREFEPTATDLSLFGDAESKSKTAMCEKEPLKRCYFDKRAVCPCNGVCPYDDRPCDANRNYFDHIYGSDCRIIETSLIEGTEAQDDDINSTDDAVSGSEGQPAPDDESEELDDENNIMQFMLDISEQSLLYARQHKKYIQSLSARERRMRRQKLFKLANVLDDLLPDPSQGKSWMVNMVLDSCKIALRAVILALSTTKVVQKPPVLRYD